MGHTEDAEEAEWAEKIKSKKANLHHSWVEKEHPGCEISGHLLVDRVPVGFRTLCCPGGWRLDPFSRRLFSDFVLDHAQGNFRIQARSPHHDLVPHMTNVSHEVHHLSIGDPFGRSMIEKGKATLPPNAARKISPMDGNAYATYDLHEAYHHYLKVITTMTPELKMGRREVKAYQIVQSSQLSYYRNDQIPEAKFTIDMSPISIHYRKSSRHWYDYLTQVMAIIGGVFTMVGLLESMVSSAMKPKRRY
jgi:hypothetical protein